MVKVALAGCASGFGYQILDAILATNKHSVILLTRAPKPSLTDRGVDVRIVDYTDRSSLVHALQGVHTVISSVSAHIPEEHFKSQIALLEAAREAKVKRFAPSEFVGMNNEGVDIFAPKIKVWEACQVSGLECTRFVCGLFLNMMVAGTPKNEAEALGGLHPFNYIIDLPAGTADILGDGKTPISFTSTQDVGRFVARSLDLERWEPISAMAGDRKTCEELVEIAERVTGGKRKLLRRYTSVEEYRKKAGEETDAFKRFPYQVGASWATGSGNYEANLNKLLPDVTPYNVEGWFKKYWEGVELPEPAWPARSA